ncbi:MAG: hypothetical protein ABI639_05580 [Thermoanaerobaculia bacterium]
MPNETPKTFAEVQEFLKDEKNNKNRLVGSTKGDDVDVFVVYCRCKDSTCAPEVAFKEETRKTRLEESFGELKKLANALDAEGCNPDWAVARKKLVEQRATLSVEAKMAKAPPSPEAPSPLPAQWLVVIDLRDGDKKGANLASQSVTILTGAREPWLLSAAIPLNNVDQLKYDLASDQIKLKEEQKTFYVSLDYTLGDALLEHPKFHEALTLKLLVAASKDPLHSVGAGLGLMPGWFSTKDNRLKILDTLSPWVGVTFTQQDEVAADGTVDHRGKRNHEFRAGICLSLTEVTGWFKKAN